MAKNKKSESPHYEMLYIVSNKFTEDELKPIIKNTETIIENHGGKITHREEWGKKKLAYKINHFSHGYYNLVEFDLAGENLQKINDLFRMSTEVLRHMIVVKESRTEEEIKKEKELSEQIYLESRKAENKKEEPKKVIKKKEKEKVKPKVDLKDLDEKLDKILDTDDLI